MAICNCVSQQLNDISHVDPAQWLNLLTSEHDVRPVLKQLMSKGKEETGN